MPNVGVDVAVALACVIALGTAAGLVWKVVRPALALIQRVDDLDERSRRDYKARLEQEKYNDASARALIAILYHLEETSHTGEMREAREQLGEFLMFNRK
jgi:hypothetical protein